MNSKHVEGRQNEIMIKSLLIRRILLIILWKTSVWSGGAAFSSYSISSIVQSNE